jgi:hypothetical protein
MGDEIKIVQQEKKKYYKTIKLQQLVKNEKNLEAKRENNYI